MATNLVRFKIKKVTTPITNVFVRITSLDRTEIFTSNTLSSDSEGNVELNIGEVGILGNVVLVAGDTYQSGEEDTFASFSGSATLEDALAVVQFLDESGRMSAFSVLDGDSELWEGV